MWIIKKPKPIKVECKFCGAIIKIKARDWQEVQIETEYYYHGNSQTKYYIRCPYCESKIYFDKGELYGRKIDRKT